MATVVYEMPDGTELELPAHLKPEQVRQAVGQYLQQRRAIADQAPAAVATPAPQHPVKAAYKAVAEPVTQAVTAGLNALTPKTADPQVNEAQRQGWEAAVRGVVVPQTPMDAMMMGATLAAPGLRAVPGLNRLPGPVQRVGAAAAGAEVGGALSGESAGQGIVRGALTTVPGEVVGRAAETIFRALPGMKTRISRQDAARIGAALEDASPPLAGARTVDDLRRLASGEGRARLGAAKEAVTVEIERGLGAHLLSVPALGPVPMSLRDANRQLSEIGARAFSKNPLDRNILGVDQRRLYGDAATQIESALAAVNPRLATTFHTAQQDYARGITLVRLFEQPSVYRNLTTGPELHTPALQRAVGTPRTQAKLERQLGSAEAAAFTSAVTRGAPAGSADVLAPGSGQVGDALRDVYGRGRGGAPQVLGSLVRTVLPNIGSQYAGRQPYQLPSWARGSVDVAAQNILRGPVSPIDEESAAWLRSQLNPLP